MSSKVVAKNTSPKKTKAVAERPAQEQPKKSAALAKTEKSSEESQAICVLRVRGAHGMKRTILNTLHLMHLFNSNHATIIHLNPSLKGMLQKTKDYVAFGPISVDILKKLLKKRGLIVGNKPLTDQHIVSNSVFKSIDDLAKAICEGKIKLKEIKDLKPVFRLHPPIGGFKGPIKRSFGAGGVCGNVGSEINNYIKRMM